MLMVASAACADRGTTGLTIFSDQIIKLAQMAGSVIVSRPTRSARPHSYDLLLHDGGSVRSLVQGIRFGRLVHYLERLSPEPIDLILVDHLLSSRFAGLGFPFVYVAHNCETRLAEDRIAHERGLLETTVARGRGMFIRSLETRLIRDALSTVALSDADADRLRGIGASRVEVIPPLAAPRPLLSDSAARRVVLVGSMRWRPKRANARWLAGPVMEQVWESVPDAELVIAGTEARRLADLSGERVRVLSDLPSLDLLYREGGVFVVPESQPSGVKIKAIEAASWGRPLVGTPEGIEGTGLTDRFSCLVGADAESFAGHVVTLLESSAMRTTLGRRARETVLRLYGWDTIATRWQLALSSWRRGT